VSSEAAACIHCGRQMTATTIERTSKSIKGTQLIAFLGFALGIAFLFGGAVESGMLIALVSGMTYLSASMLKWWRHD
jgi:hypothetical protein